MLEERNDRGAVGSPRPVGPTGGKGVTFGHVAERHAVLRGWWTVPGGTASAEPSWKDPPRGGDQLPSEGSGVRW